MNNSPLKACIYTRQSLDREGLGLAVERQLTQSEKLCEMRDWSVAARESDNDISGYSGKHRPGYERVIAMINARSVDVVVVYAIDRLTRRLSDLSALIDLCQKTGVKIATVSGDLDLSTDTGRMVARILGSVAQGEVERKATRQRDSNQQAAEMGRARKGTPRPFGWRADRIALDEAEAAAVRDACGMLLAGGTISGVIRDWDARDVWPHQRPRGAGWSRTSVRLILANPRNAGIATYNGVEVGRGEWEPIVAEETWRAVCDVLAANAGRRAAPSPRTMLSGLGRCLCGNFVVGTWSGDGKRPAYRCHQLTRDGRPGPHVFVRRDVVDEWVGALVAERLSRPDAIDLIEAPAGIDAGALRDEAAALRERLGRLGPLFAKGAISERDLTGGRLAGEARLAEIAADLAEAGRGSVLAPLIAADDVAAAWAALDMSLRRSAVAALMTVTLVPPGKGAHTWDPERVVRVDWIPSRAA